jgi:outer membrane lipoprotein-sorting protein
MTWFITVVSISILSQSAIFQTPPLPEPVARFWQKVAKAKTLSVTVREWGEDAARPETAGKILVLNNVADVKIQRPNLVSILGQPPKVQEEHKSGTTISVRFFGGGETFISDGQRGIQLMTLFHIFELVKPLEKLTPYKDSPVHNLNLAWVFGERPMNELNPFVKDERAQPPVLGTVFVIKDPTGKPFEEWSYFDSKSGNLMRWSAYYWDDKGRVIESMRTEYQFWEFDPKLPKSTFDTNPPKGWTPRPTRPARPPGGLGNDKQREPSLR